MIDIIGWIGSMLLTFCGAPLAYKAIRSGNANGISWGFLSMWGGGEVFTLLYVLPMLDYPLILNYSANIVFISIVVAYKIIGEKNGK